MSWLARATIGVSVLALCWYLVVIGFAMDDVALEREVSLSRSNYISGQQGNLSTETTGDFSVSSIKDISFIQRFIITTKGLPWWFNLFVGLFNGLFLVLMTTLWIIKIIHGNG